MRLGLDFARARGWTAALAVTALSLGAAACSSGGSSTNAGGPGTGSSSTGGSAATTAGPATSTFTDASGRKVAIPVEAKHLGLPFPCNTSDAILLGAREHPAASWE